MKIYMILFACGLFICGCTSFNSKTKSNPDPLSGEWVFTILTYSVSDIEVDLKTKAAFIKTDDGSYFGTYETLRPEYPEELNITTQNEMPKYELENIELDGNKLTFEYVGYREGRSKFSGKIEGNTITGVQKLIIDDRERTFGDEKITGTKVK